MFFSDDPLPRQSNQVQAAEDILDKYRNIKRTSPSDGASGGPSYDGTGGENYLVYKNISHIALDRAINLVLFLLTDRCVEDGVHDYSRDDALQNMSADDLPDSASQTAQQHDTKFSFRSLSCSQPTDSHLHSLTQDSLKILSNWFHFWGIIVF